LTGSGRNRWLALAALGESLGAFFAIYAGLLYFDYPPLLGRRPPRSAPRFPRSGDGRGARFARFRQIPERMLLFTA